MSLPDRRIESACAFQTAYFAHPVQRRLAGCKQQICSNTRMTATTEGTPSFSYPRRVSRAVVWFRDGDLRVEDHPGLEEACAHTSEALAPLLVCTPRTKPETLRAASRLQNELREKGSHLVLRYAEDESTGVIQFLREFQAERVHVRMDVEKEAYDVIMEVEGAVDGLATIQTWRTELREWDYNDEEALLDLPSEYQQFLRWRPRREAAISSSSADFQPEVILPGPGLEDTSFPIDEISDQVIAASSSKSLDSPTFDSQIQQDREYVKVLTFDDSVRNYGEYGLKAFLRRSDAYEELDPARSLAELLRQGALSPGRIYEIVIEHERMNGRLWRPVYREGAKAVLDWLDSREHLTLMARRDVQLRETVDGQHEAKFWRWNGCLIRYVEEGRQHAINGKPPLLLIHGFGASCQHFRRSLGVLKERYHVFAFDLVGFGRSEKPPAQYTQAFWEAQVFDFVREVIGKPVFVAGNSIGGYITCAFAVDAHPKWCVGACLINSAGKLEDLPLADQKTPEQEGAFTYIMKRSSALRSLFGKALLRSLQGRVQKTLKKVYPVNPEAADEELAKEILRNSTDYGATAVIGSGFILPPPRSLSRLLSMYNGPLLVFQGVLDPLNNTRNRADTILQQYPAATIVQVQGGHCPHEENAVEFVEAISTWMDSVNARAPEAVLVRDEGRGSSAVPSEMKG